ncbi:MAG: hypothetical protein ACJAY8_000234 [Sphingobacteriales bacterium]|jgi:hypothetical protein
MTTKYSLIHFFAISLILLGACSTPTAVKTDEVKKIIRYGGDGPSSKKILDLFGAEKTVIYDYSKGEKNADFGQHLGPKKMGPKNQFAGTIELEVSPNMQVLVYSFWKKTETGKVTAVVSNARSSEKYYRSNSIIQERDSAGWERVQIVVHPFEDLYGEPLRIYAYCSEGESEIDDFQFEVYYAEEKPFAGLDTLYFDFSEKEWKKIKKIRKKALKKGMLTSDLNKYIKGEFREGSKGKKKKIEARLKGDWPDHWKDKQWSLRVKIKGDDTYNGTEVFNIQSPETRGFLGEYLIHKMAEKEGILTTNYDFVNVYINGEFNGVYAFEEHFRKELVERQERREGPIFKWNESYFWERIGPEHGDYNFHSYSMVAPIEPFGMKKIAKNKTQKKLFIQGRNSLVGFLEGSVAPSTLFDLGYMASWFALFDVSSSTHGKAWHNIRFYSNPVNAKLELIFYDCYTEFQPKLDLEYSIENDFNKEVHYDSHHLGQLFESQKFRKLYLRKLSELSNPEYLDLFYAELDSNLKVRQRALESWFKTANLNGDILRKRSQNTLQKLAIEGDIWEKTNGKLNRKKESLDKLVPSELLVQAFRDGKTVSVLNFNPELQLLGHSKKGKKKSIKKLKQTLRRSTGNYDEITIIGVSEKSNYLHFSLDNTDFKIAINPFPAPKSKMATPTKKSNKKENFTFSEDQTIHHLLIVDGFTTFKSCTLKLKEGGGILVRGNVDMENVLVLGSKGNYGFTVLAEGDTNTIANTRFEGLENPRFDDWSLTGAVTLYRGFSNITNTQFLNNQSEDALNIFNGTFNMHKCSIDGTYADAFDGDFVTGTISDSRFSNTGNDAIDFSGSRIKVIRTVFSKISDKAISGGERSYIEAEKCKIDSANFAIASKDKSVVIAREIRISNSKVGLAVYCKKPEIGVGSMTASDITFIGVDQNTLLDKGSTLTLENKTTIGTEVLDIDKIYEPFKYQRKN